MLQLVKYVYWVHNFTSGIGDVHVRRNMGTAGTWEQQEQQQQQVVSWGTRNLFGAPKSLVENASKVGI
ncbi:MAG: hypothetical protein LBE13_01245 [Bacteroidales bacterium]|nr:hypothetical protein [Bacteroidales bacterium]